MSCCTAIPRPLAAALRSISLTLADYARWLVTPIEQGGAGVDGVFYAVTGTAASGYFTRDEYREFAEPYDRIVLERAGDNVKLFHTCQDHANPEWFLDYGIDALQWDHFLAGNPSLEAVRSSGRLGPITPVQGPPRNCWPPTRARSCCAGRSTTSYVKTTAGRSCSAQAARCPRRRMLRG